MDNLAALLQSLSKRGDAEAVDRSGILNDGDRLLLPLPLHHVYP